eukprot:TRINITY_DN3389_c0_g1_i16.p1 TRINITY_DN3389_c0_g1~~TRINITY_DN3389_c0_g1_i16.p1  ORF type:complete len:538 (-),score=73.31 TRINITY_DN3389_c0_g1_i16:288-1901(-)
MNEVRSTTTSFIGKGGAKASLNCIELKESNKINCSTKPQFSAKLPNRYDSSYSEFLLSLKKRRERYKVRAVSGVRSIRNSCDQHFATEHKAKAHSGRFRNLPPKPRTHSFVTRRQTFKNLRTTYTAVSGAKNSKVYVGDNPFVYFCDKFAKNSLRKIFNASIPRMLEARFEKLAEFGKSTDKTVLLTSDIAQLMKNEGFGVTFAERIATLIDIKYKTFDQSKFASLLLNVLTEDDKALRLCFDVLRVTEKDFLDYVGLAAWFQSDAEPLLRNDLLSICKLFKVSGIAGWSNSRVLKKDSRAEEDKKRKRQHFAWDLGLWGSACRKSVRRAHDRSLISYRTCRKEENAKPSTLYDMYISVPKDDRITFAQFKQVAFGNKGLPDTLFLIIQLVYGTAVCDAYCNHLGIKLFRPFNKTQNCLTLKRIYPLPLETLIEFRYAQYDMSREKLYDEVNSSVETRTTAKVVKKVAVELYMRLMDQSNLNNYIVYNDFISHSVVFLLLNCRTRYLGRRLQDWAVFALNYCQVCIHEDSSLKCLHS